jgi:hypothetical protein
MPMEPVWLQGGCVMDPRPHRCDSSDAEGGDPDGSSGEGMTCSECGGGGSAAVVSRALTDDDRTAVSHVLVLLARKAQAGVLRAGIAPSRLFTSPARTMLERWLSSGQLVTRTDALSRTKSTRGYL